MPRLIILTALILGLLPNIGVSHQQKEAYISLLFNQHSGKLEVSHRFLLHDAEHALASVLGNTAGDLSLDEHTQSRFARYVQDHFLLRNKNDQTIDLELLGYEVDGKNFWVYQETDFPNTAALKLKHSALHELWPSHTNHINVEKDGWVKSARLQKQDNTKWQTISLNEPK